jgi:signal transduction histidine kinase
MKYEIATNIQKPYIKSNGNIIVDINNEFVSMTGFERDDFVGKTLEQAGMALRTFDQVNLETVQGFIDIYIFTKLLEPLEVKLKIIEYNNTKTFYFINHSISMINERFAFAEQFYVDKRTSVCIMTYPDLVLLTANDNYFITEECPYIDKLRDYNIGRKQLHTMPTSEMDHGEEFYFELASQNKTFHIEEYQHKDNNKTTYWNISLVPISVEGKVKSFVQGKLDVTDKVMTRRHIEDQSNIIKQQNKKLEAIIENISEAIIIYDKDGKPSTMNKSARDMISCKTEQGDIDRSFENLQFYDLKGSPIPAEESPVNKIKQGERISDAKIQLKFADENRFMELSGSPVYDNSGNFITGILCCHDITTRMKFHEMEYVKLQYEMLNKIIENLDMAVLRLSYPEIRVKDMNQKVLNLVQMSKPWFTSIESTRMKELNELFSKEFSDEMTNDIRYLIKNNRYSFVSNKAYFEDNDEKHTKYIYQPVRGLTNEIVEIAIIAFDVTQEIKARHQVEHNMKMQEEIFANISHELKTPLNVIFSIAQLFEFYITNHIMEDTTGKISKGIHTMKQNCYRLTRLISNIVDMSKLESGFVTLNLSNNNIVDVAEEIVQSVAEYVQDRGMHIVFDTDVEEKIIACDPYKIERILLNLISNAIKFSDTGNEIFVNVEDHGNTVQISVKDQGIGIESNMLDTIFDRYHQVDKSLTRNTEGSGIGLSLVKSIVELHGGQITAESEAGNGSVFRISLPVTTIAMDNPSKTNIDDLNMKKIYMISVEFSDIYDI